ncbi:MAG: hypothetical protein ACR2JS_08630 [Candidatus Nanopelagicales bacterium]
MTQSRGRRRGAIALVIAVVFAASGAIGVLLTRSSEQQAVPAPQPTPTATAMPVNSGTLLLQLKDSTGQAVVNALLGGEPDLHAGSALSLPPGLLIATPAVMALAATPGSADTLAAKNGISTSLLVRVDATLTLDRLALAGLVESVNGVTVDLGLGSVTLDGVTAADYATSLRPGDSEADRQLRAQAVITQALRGLPENDEAMRQLLASLGSLARSTATNDELVPLLEQIRLDALSGTMLKGDLPVTVVTSGATDAVVVDRSRAQAVLEEMFPTDILSTGQTPLPRVVLEAAGASAGYALKVRRQLTDAGVAVIDGGVSAAPLRVSRVLLNAAVPRSRDLGFSIAESLGLPEWAVRASTDSPVDVIVRLGADEGLLP